MDKSFIFLLISTFQRGKDLASTQSMIPCYQFPKPKPGLVMSQDVPSPLPAQTSSECKWVVVSSGLLPKKVPVGEMLTVSSRQGKVSSQISQDHLRWRSVLAKGSFSQTITYSRSSVQGREPGQPQIETPATGQSGQAPKLVDVARQMRPWKVAEINKGCQGVGKQLVGRYKMTFTCIQEKHNKVCPEEHLGEAFNFLGVSSANLLLSISGLFCGLFYWDNEQSMVAFHLTESQVSDGPLNPKCLERKRTPGIDYEKLFSVWTPAVPWPQKGVHWSRWALS